jgi:hypothetical protein
VHTHTLKSAQRTREQGKRRRRGHVPRQKTTTAAFHVASPPCCQFFWPRRSLWSRSGTITHADLLFFSFFRIVPFIVVAVVDLWATRLSLLLLCPTIASARPPPPPAAAQTKVERQIEHKKKRPHARVLFLSIFGRPFCSCERSWQQWISPKCHLDPLEKRRLPRRARLARPRVRSPMTRRRPR